MCYTQVNKNLGGPSPWVPLSQVTTGPFRTKPFVVAQEVGFFSLIHIFKSPNSIPHACKCEDRGLDVQVYVSVYAH